MTRDKSQGLYIVNTPTGDRSVWYDRALRVWTEQVNDAGGNQIGTVNYTVDKREAFGWLKTGTE
jgi:hypothetical protein